MYHRQNIISTAATSNRVYRCLVFRSKGERSFVRIAVIWRRELGVEDISIPNLSFSISFALLVPNPPVPLFTLPNLSFPYPIRAGAAGARGRGWCGCAKCVWGCLGFDQCPKGPKVTASSTVKSPYATPSVWSALYHPGLSQPFSEVL